MKRIIYIISVFAVVNLYASKSLEINLSKQKIYAKENGEVLFSAPVSTGKSGHSTPKGKFKILDKEKFHISNKYPEPNGGAKMPYMLRLTNGGIAIHQGYLPGYPASHGCIRVSKSTAKKLWYWTSRGVPVKIYGDASNFKYKKRREKAKSIHKSRNRKHIVHRKHKRKRAKRHYAHKDSYEIIEVIDSW